MCLLASPTSFSARKRCAPSRVAPLVVDHGATQGQYDSPACSAQPRQGAMAGRFHDWGCAGAEAQERRLLGGHPGSSKACAGACSLVLGVGPGRLGMVPDIRRACRPRRKRAAAGK